MDKRRLIILGIIALLAVAGISALLLLPEVTAFSPEAVRGGQPNSAAIEITFNRRMQPESVAAGLSISPEIEGKLVWDENTVRFIPMEAWPSGTQVDIRLTSGLRSRLGLPTRSQTSWSFRVAPVSLGYLWPADGDSQLYLLDIDSGETIQLTFGERVLAYDFSPDGRTAYYFAGNTQGGSDLYSLDRFDPQAEPVRLLTCQRAQCNNPVLSPEGTLLAYTRNDNAVWLLDLESGGEPRRISPEGDDAYQPLWASESLLNYYNASQQVYLVADTRTGKETEWPNQSGDTAAWAPGGTALVAPDAFLYETDILRGPSGEAANEEVDESDLEPVRVLSSRLMVYQLNGGRIIELTEDPLAEDFWPAFSPDGTTLAFTRRFLDEDRWTPGRQVWLMSLPGGGTSPVQIKPLTDAEDYLYTMPTWHPDGDQLAAVRFNITLLTDPPEIWLLSLNGSAIRLVIGGFQPQWIP